MLVGMTGYGYCKAMKIRYFPSVIVRSGLLEGLSVLLAVDNASDIQYQNFFYDKQITTLP